MESFLILIAASLISCSGTLSPKDYVSYVQNPDNGLLVNSNVNGVDYSLQYQPTDYLVMLELKSFSISSDDFKKQYDRFKGIEHYVFHIDMKGLAALSSQMSDTSKSKSALKDYFNFGVQKDIKLVEGHDTIPCGIAECESSMGMLPYYSILLGFPKNNYSGDRQFVFNGKRIGIGEIKILVKGRSITDLPKLKMNG